ncbi:MAG: TonB-dependent receptor, partial [Bacteroidota bacterium]
MPSTTTHLLTFSLLFLVQLVCAQTAIIQGNVVDPQNEAMPGITVMLDNDLGVATDVSGNFILRDISPGKHTLAVSGVGYASQAQTVRLAADQTLRIAIQLEEGRTEMDEIIIQGKSEAQERREQPIKIEVINTEKLQAQSTSLPQIINQTAGVRVRQTAGVGSGTTININGLQGRAIRYFRDDIPLDYLGQAYELSLVPIGQLGGIEIYKGILPAKLGADALGGAINFTTREFYENQLDLSYGYGSFNTHQANLAGYWNIPNSKFFTQVSSYYVYSDNDYEIDVEVIDEETQTLRPAVVERFHDGVESSFIEAKAGLKDHKIADLLEIGYARFDMNKENQHGFNILRPFGEVHYEEHFNAFTTRYKKEIGNLSIDLFGAWSQKNTLLADTSSRRYDWFGNVTVVGGTNGGEADDDNKSLLNLNFDHAIGRVFLSYQLGSSVLSFNHNIVSQTRTGSDPLGYTVPIGDEDIDPFSVPADYLKNISGLQLTKTFLGDRNTHLITAKRYAITTSSLSRTSFEDFTPDLTNESYGFGSSLKYSFSDNRFI